MVSVPSHTPNTPSPRPGGKVIVVHMLLIVPSVVLVLQGTLTHGVIWDSDQFGNVQGSAGVKYTSLRSLLRRFPLSG